MGRRSARKKQFPFGIVLISALIVIAIVGVGIGYWTLVGSPGSDSSDVAAGTPVTIEIPQGTSVAGIADILEENDIIGNATVFRGQVRLADADATLLAGVYQMYTGMAINDIIAMLQQGPPRRDVVTVTIPEGRSIDRMALILEESMNFSADDFTQRAKNGAE